MPIFKKSNILFIHIPKTGGSSIEKQLYNLEDLSDQYTTETYFSNNPLMMTDTRNYSLQHYTFIDLLSCLGQERINHFQTIFCVVRNPYDRMVSEFYYYYQRIVCESLDFDSIEHIQSKFFDFCQKCVNGQVNNDNHQTPQYTYIINHQEIIDPRIKILWFERLSTEFSQLCGLTLDYHLLQSNRKLSCHEYYTPESQQLVKDYYMNDFILFYYDPNVLPMGF